MTQDVIHQCESGLHFLMKHGNNVALLYEVDDHRSFSCAFYARYLIQSLDPTPAPATQITDITEHWICMFKGILFSAPHKISITAVFDC